MGTPRILCCGESLRKIFQPETERSCLRVNRQSTSHNCWWIADTTGPNGPVGHTVLREVQVIALRCKELQSHFLDNVGICVLGLIESSCF